ncbi:MAG: phosphate ABC transporter substrate-binding protein PstS family protein [Oscillospiraceae bacterium]|nr:phosphate ABC transporter substrate-binding protein PstS family protein [Oscillospiraceae bacterium]
MKKITALILVFVMVLSFMPVMAAAPAASSARTLIVDGVTIVPAASRVTSNDTFLVSTDVLPVAFGADVEIDTDARTAVIKTAAFTMKFTAGASTVTVNGASRALPASAVITGGNFLVPIRFIASTIGGTTAYNPTTKTVAILYFTRLSGSLKISGSTTVQPIAQGAADKLIAANNGRLSITVSGGGSGAGIRDVTNGTVHIGMSSRDLTADELRQLSACPVANDGVAVILHPGNGVTNLTSDQVRKIFTGEIRNWREVGGHNGAIMLYVRETGSGTRDTFETMIMNRQPVASRATPFTSNALVLQNVAKQRNSVGYISVGYLNKTVKALSIDNILPTAETVIDKTYLINRYLYLCTKGPAKGLAAVFMDYIRSSAIQDEVVEKEGYVSLR